jgi:hypothetical protein
VKEEMARKPIPAELQRKVLYESAYVCAICQAHAVQIHGDVSWLGFVTWR